MWTGTALARMCVCVCVCVSVFLRVYLFTKGAEPRDISIAWKGLPRCFWRSVLCRRRALFHEHCTCFCRRSDFPHEVFVCVRTTSAFHPHGVHVLWLISPHGVPVFLSACSFRHLTLFSLSTHTATQLHASLFVLQKGAWPVYQLSRSSAFFVFWRMCLSASVCGFGLLAAAVAAAVWVVGWLRSSVYTAVSG